MPLRNCEPPAGAVRKRIEARNKLGYHSYCVLPEVVFGRSRLHRWTIFSFFCWALPGPAS